MKHPALLLSALLAAAAATAAQPDRSVVRAPVKEGSRQLAFPGAVGWGRFARGARAGADDSLSDAVARLREASCFPDLVAACEEAILDHWADLRLLGRACSARGVSVEGLKEAWDEAEGNLASLA